MMTAKQCESVCSLGKGEMDLKKDQGLHLRNQPVRTYKKGEK